MPAFILGLLSSGGALMSTVAKLGIIYFIIRVVIQVFGIAIIYFGAISPLLDNAQTEILNYYHTAGFALQIYQVLNYIGIIDYFTIYISAILAILAYRGTSRLIFGKYN